MVAAGVLAKSRGMVDEVFVERQQACIERFGLPVRWAELPVNAAAAAMKHDKKARAGTLKFILAEGMGRAVQRTDVTEDEVIAALDALK